MRLEVYFRDVQNMELFSDTNSIQFHTAKWELLEILQENSTKPITWEPSNMRRLLGRSLAEGQETELRINVSLRHDKFGKNLCTRISTLERMLSSGL